MLRRSWVVGAGSRRSLLWWVGEGKDGDESVGVKAMMSGVAMPGAGDKAPGTGKGSPQVWEVWGESPGGVATGWPWCGGCHQQGAEGMGTAPGSGRFEGLPLAATKRGQDNGGAGWAPQRSSKRALDGVGVARGRAGCGGWQV